jgi:hypothetical protein
MSHNELVRGVQDSFTAVDPHISQQPKLAEYVGGEDPEINVDSLKSELLFPVHTEVFNPLEPCHLCRCVRSESQPVPFNQRDCGAGWRARVNGLLYSGWRLGHFPSS